MINAEQIRAARAMLDWTTAMLAERADMTVNGINKIEREHVVAQRSTLEKIQQVFEAAGIEFLPGSGIRKKDRFVEIYEGENCTQRLLDDVFHTLSKKGGGEVCIAHVDENNFVSKTSPEKMMRHLERIKNSYITERLLIRDSDEKLIAPAEAYHAHDEIYFSSNPLYIYGSKLALVCWHTPEKAIIVDDERFADSVRRLFNFVWDHTKQPKRKS